ncbi:DUF2182 domain-containing protein [Paraburkholderia pallida]|uniref:DUF2182 domain-containing protein n=1 Tax=Paraburkholderia pallida TaxID=2547399 RepID=A0A4P7D4T7_9BURK|nr:DUF2182 domain-containing protein [Paraburkholderia pallida]QBR01890.1 DUF2182 domain-containing protein [Paraburkholderia pallida]
MNIVDIARVPGASRREKSPRVASNAILIGAAALLFAASAATTVRRYAYMATMSGTPMAGRWMLSAIWTPMCGQTWLHAAASFACMWAVMMPAMMLPVLVPMLLRERTTWRDIAPIRSALLIILAGTGYFLVWMLAGCAVFPLGAALAAIALRVPAFAHAAPAAAGAVVVLASLLQFTSWKAKRLAWCHDMRQCTRHAPASACAALRRGMRLGLSCASCCGNWMIVLLALGVMDLGSMAIVTAAIAAERMAPCQGQIARILGLAGVAAGVSMMVRGF